MSTPPKLHLSGCTARSEALARVEQWAEDLAVHHVLTFVDDVMGAVARGECDADAAQAAIEMAGREANRTRLELKRATLEELDAILPPTEH